MKFTDNFFEFPIKIYDKFSLKTAMETEDSLNIPVDADWVSSKAKIPFEELPLIFYYEGFTKGRGVEEVAKRGFDLTMIETRNFGDFVCVWKLDKFEQKLNEFVEKRLSDKLNISRSLEQPAPSRKVPWYKKMGRII